MLSNSLPRDLSTTLEMTGRRSVSFYFIVLFCKYGRSRPAHRGSLSAGRGRPALPRRNTTFQTNTCPRRLAVGRTRIDPTTLYQSLYLPLYNVISTEVRVKPERSGEIPCGSHPTTILPQLFSTFKALRGLGHSRKAVSHRGRVDM